jgi:metal-responsive CopG/Arc/MetJ family transcriptional regulator
MNDKQMITLYIDTGLLEKVDRYWRIMGYSSRAEFIRDAIVSTAVLDTDDTVAGLLGNGAPEGANG